MFKTFILLFLFCGFVNAQDYKSDISVVQYSASFVKDNELNLKKFNEHNTYYFYIETDKKLFENDKIKYLPTIVIFQNGKEILRIESGVSLKLPEDAAKKIDRKLNELLQNKF
jgi:thiol-disulfide isomerase/thioredoxin|tara:strand:- start:4 stop:342 length:339 start_codon:yes stop_codon:yes gene_type:complete